ncbi:hypothetical protein JKF63_05084 [Porcisia hertigi]|uniref:SET domain-containing protein n=1 Tax=Porcisia hertigi TaxID=2761500 RepID=A0A836LI72_9TRYP|nr:hypothetical protein JKF63_05084 [Porcisia hertigi]
MQGGDVVTRLGPSERLAGLRGVFLTKSIKKYHPIEVLPDAASATAATTSAPVHDRSTGQPGTPLGLTSAGVTQAPPLVINLAFAPRHHISLRRFLALRHMYSTSSYLHVATEKGWHLVAPSTAAPLCADVVGLQAWCSRHHHRYLHSEAPVAKESMSSRAAHLGRHTDIAKMEAAQERGSVGPPPEWDRDDNTDEADGTTFSAVDESHHPANQQVVASTRNTLDGRSAGAPAPASGLVSPPQLKTSPPLIKEAHLFEINDGVAWPLPPSDDLANHEYWEGHRQRMTLYESTGDADTSEQREALLTALRADPEVARRLSSEQELHAAAERLFQALKQKANVALHIDADTDLLTLVPLRDLHAGEELFLHYGREWWTGRLLFSLLLAVPDAEMSQIRWIEQLFYHTVDTNELFPLLIAAHQQRKRPRHRSAGRKVARQSLKCSDSGGSGPTPASCRVPPHPLSDTTGASSAVTTAAEQPVSQRKVVGRLVLYNTVTRKRATDAAALAFAVRRSCTDQGFLDRLVVGDIAGGIAPIFSISEPDKEIPMRVLRRILLASLRGLTASPQEDVSHNHKRAAATAVSSAANTTTTATAQDDSPPMRTDAGADGADGDDADDAVFSV